jgi:hypothetical protein
MSDCTESVAVPAVYGAIADVMGKLSKVGISKDNKNAQQGYKFRGIDDVYNALAPFLSESRLLILPRVLSRSVTERETKSGGALFYVVLDVEFDFVAAVDGSRHVVRVVGEAMDSGDKATNKAMSAAYKYACMEAFCIPTEGDNDADAHTHEIKGINPRGDAKADKAVIDAWCKSITDMLANDQVSHTDAVYKAHLDLAQDNDLYICVADELAARGIIGKAKWKELVKAGKSNGF